MVLAVAMSMGFISLSVYYVNKLFVQATRDILVRFILIIFASLVAVFIIDKIVKDEDGFASIMANWIDNVNDPNGQNNIALGLNALKCNTVTSDNIAIGRSATATASNQFVVGSAAYPAGSVVVGANVSSQYWNVIINGTAYKILLA